MTVRLTTLGNTGVRRGEKALPSLPGKPMSFGLLVFLSLEREVTRDRLISIFWPEVDQERARQRLNQSLYELKKELGEGWLESSGTRVRVTESVQADALEFEEHLQEDRVGAALSLYHAHFLEGVHLAPTHPFEEWVERKRARLARRHRVAADSHITTLHASSQAEEALQVAWKWVGLDPLDDGAQHHLISLLWANGSRTEALAQYERYATLLDTELGLEPLDETKELVEEIRSGVPPPSRTSSPEAHDPPDPTPPPVPGDLSTDDAPGNALARMKDLFLSEPSGPLEVLRPIREGGTAPVFLAREPHLRRLVALKVLSPELSRDPVSRKRFEREAQSAARIQHPNVCVVLRTGVLPDGTPFLVTPFVKGTSLAQRLEGEGRLGPAEVRKVLQETAAALSAAHDLGIIHRDVQPDNVLCEDGSDRYFLCDFGLAGVLESGESADTPLTLTGQILGDPSYMSPEQGRGEPLTDRSDVFSLGVMGYELLTGAPPSGAIRWSEGEAEGRDASALREYTRGWPASHQGLVELLFRCMAADPAHRPSVADLVDQLGAISEMNEEGAHPDKGNRSFLRRLFDRRLPQFLGGYIAAAWMAVESSGYLVTRGILPETVESLTLASAPFGFLVVTITGWFHGERGPQTMPRLEKWLLAGVGIGWLAVCAMAL